MRINAELVVGGLMTLASAYYWAAIGNVRPVQEVPLVYQYTFRLYPYLDTAITAVGMLVLYRGLRRLKEG
ncbi:MAG: hypothetical protein AB1805_04900 [Nitrospirota bacterium]